MLADLGEAEDAVQETMIRAWRNADRFDERKAGLRTWLYRIASNVCIDMLRSSQRRGLAMDLTSASAPGPDPGSPVGLSRFVQPVPDHRLLSEGGDPAELAVQRETIRLAFVAALQQLPPRQRAVLILRRVLGWSATEAADLLDTSPTAVNSLLQRARTTLPLLRPHDADLGTHDESLLARYVEAFTTHDVAGLVALLHEDATMSMPPYLWWAAGTAGDPSSPSRRCNRVRQRPIGAHCSQRLAGLCPLPGRRSFGCDCHRPARHRHRTHHHVPGTVPRAHVRPTDDSRPTGAYVEA